MAPLNSPEVQVCPPKIIVKGIDYFQLHEQPVGFNLANNLKTFCGLCHRFRI